jgi:hypothetical protein
VRFIRTSAAAAVFGVAAFGISTFGFAAPAHADQVMQGIYTYTQDDGLTGTFTIYPICTPTVGDLRVPLELPVACTMHVQAAPAASLQGGDARLTGALWTYQKPIKDGLTCPDGSTAPTIETYKFDDITMTGTRSIAHNADCGMAPGITNHNFTLAFKDPLPVPVDRYPLNCEPAGLRICN